jgi:hypothetical protein
MQLLARFLFDGGRIGLKRFDLVHVLTVFLLQPVDFLPQRLQLAALLAIDHHAVGAEHGMQEYANYKDYGGGGSQTTPLQGEPRPRRARTFNATRRRGFGLGTVMPGLIFRLTYGLPYRLAHGLPHGLIHGLIHGATCCLAHNLTDGRASAWKDARP